MPCMKPMFLLAVSLLLPLASGWLPAAEFELREGDRVVLLDEGRILTAGTPAELVSQAGARDLDDAFVTLTGKEVEEVEA